MILSLSRSACLGVGYFITPLHFSTAKSRGRRHINSPWRPRSRQGRCPPREPRRRAPRTNPMTAIKGGGQRRMRINGVRAAGRNREIYVKHHLMANRTLVSIGRVCAAGSSCKTRGVYRSHGDKESIQKRNSQTASKRTSPSGVAAPKILTRTRATKYFWH